MTARLRPARPAMDKREHACVLHRGERRGGAAPCSLCGAALLPVCSECPNLLDGRLDQYTCGTLCRGRRWRRLNGMQPSIPHRRDELDRYYTDPEVARRCTLAVLPHLLKHTSGGRVLVEPSVGGGSFLLVVRELLPTVAVVGIDSDPRSRVLKQYSADYNVLADFKVWAPRGGLRIGVFLGNPPYNEAEEHCRRAFELAGKDGMVAFLLPLAFRASKKRRAFWRMYPAPITRALEERPSFTGDGKTDARDYALYAWGQHIPVEPGIGAV